MSNIVGMGIDDTNNLVFAWFDDQMGQRRVVQKPEFKEKA